MTIDAQDSNIIIPHGITLVQNDVTFGIQGNNVNLIIRGKIDNTTNSYDYYNSLFYFYGKANIIIGSTATINFNNARHDPVFMLNNDLSNVLLYPGCNINTQKYKQGKNILVITDGNGNENNYRSVIKSNGTLWLNKYNGTDNKRCTAIAGTISQNMKIIFPLDATIPCVYIKHSTGNTGYITSANFPNLYWIYLVSNEHTAGLVGDMHVGQYAFKNRDDLANHKYDELYA